MDKSAKVPGDGIFLGCTNLTENTAGTAHQAMDRRVPSPVHSRGREIEVLLGRLRPRQSPRQPRPRLRSGRWGSCVGYLAQVTILGGQKSACTGLGIALSFFFWGGGGLFALLRKTHYDGPSKLELTEEECRALSIVVLRTDTESERYGASHHLNWIRSALAGRIAKQISWMKGVCQHLAQPQHFDSSLVVSL